MRFVPAARVTRGPLAGLPGVTWLRAVEAALDEAAEPVEIFFRDDDVGWRTDRLLALLDVFDSSGMPLDLAIIPAELDEPLAAELRARAAWLGVHQHGLAHRNHELSGRKHEFGPSRSRARQRADIEAGARRLNELLGDIPEPIFTPPWNRCTADTGHCLVDLGFHVLSRESRAAPLAIPGLQELPVRVDWVVPEPGERAAAAIRDARPVGIMFHHAVMAADDRRKADQLLALVAGHPQAHPRRMLECAGSGRIPR
jgi:hypothetical protein